MSFIFRFVFFLLKLAVPCALVLCYRGTPSFLQSRLLPQDGVFSAVPPCVQDTLGVVVLGGGFSRVNGSFSEKPSLSHSSQKRIESALRLLKSANENGFWGERKIPVVFSGGGRFQQREPAEAVLMDEVLQKQALDKKTSLKPYLFLKEEKSKNTYENAVFSASLFDRYSLPKRIVLVTSAFHMLRAKATFEKQGFFVCPLYVLDQYSEKTADPDWFQLSYGKKSLFFLREDLGIFVYAVLGWVPQTTPLSLLKNLW